MARLPASDRKYNIRLQGRIAFSVRAIWEARNGSSRRLSSGRRGEVRVGFVQWEVSCLTFRWL